MKSRFIDALMILAENAENDAAIIGDSHRARELLLDSGYLPEEADRAIECARDHLKPSEVSSLRVLSGFERSQLTTDGRGILIRLRDLGLLTDEHVELIMARALLLGEGPIDAESIKNMATVLLFDLEAGEPGFPFYIDSSGGDLEN